MNINLVCPIMVLENKTNTNIRKTDTKVLKLLVTKENEELVTIPLIGTKDIKKVLRETITNIINSDEFHLEQVYTLGEEKYYLESAVDIIYLAITNSKNIKMIDNKYKLVDFSIKNNIIEFNKKNYSFKTMEKISHNNIEYYHTIQVKDIKLEKKLLEIIICYKQLRNKIDCSDIIFKFMGNTFTLEEIRLVYELIKEKKVDKSNFRKKIMKYCKEVSIDTTKKGYRPSKIYTFQVLKGDIWL